jgi:hypothetical protein
MRRDLHIPASAAQTVAHARSFGFSFWCRRKVFAKQTHLTAAAKPGSVAATYPAAICDRLTPQALSASQALGTYTHYRDPLTRAGAFPCCSEMLQCASMRRLLLNTAALELINNRD